MTTAERLNTIFNDISSMPIRNPEHENYISYAVKRVTELARSLNIQLKTDPDYIAIRDELRIISLCRGITGLSDYPASLMFDIESTLLYASDC
jgi:hypothetical protein